MVKQQEASTNSSSAQREPVWVLSHEEEDWTFHVVVNGTDYAYNPFSGNSLTPLYSSPADAGDILVYRNEKPLPAWLPRLFDSPDAASRCIKEHYVRSWIEEGLRSCFSMEKGDDFCKYKLQVFDQPIFSSYASQDCLRALFGSRANFRRSIGSLFSIPKLEALIAIASQYDLKTAEKILSQILEFGSTPKQKERRNVECESIGI